MTTLSSSELVNEYEKMLGKNLPDQYKYFLKKKSNIVAGTVNPFSFADKNDITELLSLIKTAHDLGVPSTWIPFCEDNGDYYCFEKDGKVCFWSHNGTTNEKWENFAEWVKKVWIDEE